MSMDVYGLFPALKDPVKSIWSLTWPGVISGLGSGEPSYGVRGNRNSKLFRIEPDS